MDEAITKVDPMQAVFDEIGEILQKHGIANALLLVRTPEPTEDDGPSRMWFRGEFYEAAKLAAFGSSAIRSIMNQDLRGL
jgi:hypothetical protein